VLSVGPITINNLTASYNDDKGANLSNTLGDLKDVKLTGTNFFVENDLTGLDVHSKGAISLNSVTANGNGQDMIGGQGFGVYLENQFASIAKPVTITGTNTFNNNYEDGLRVVSKGAITTNALSASYNGTLTASTGIYLANTVSGVSNLVKMTGNNSSNNNGGAGFDIYSYGAVTLNSLTANNNGDEGAQISNYDILNSYNVGVTLTGTNTFNGNGSQGLTIASPGAISVSNVTANGNTNSNAILDNDSFAFGTAGITLTGTNTFNESISGDGLNIATKGSVSISNITADDNFSDGLDSYSEGNVTVTCGSITSNGDYGYYFDSLGGITVTLKGVYSFGNTLGNVYTGTLVYIRSC
jgi:hypothetical protein